MWKLAAITFVLLCLGLSGCSPLPPLEDAINSNRTQQAADMINKGQGLSELDAIQRTPLHWVAIKDNVEIGKLLISKGVPVDAICRGGDTPLCVAAIKCHLAACRLLVENGAQVNVADGAGSSPLILACVRTKVEDDATQRVPIVELLIQHGADVNARTTQGWTPLHCAAESADPDVVRILLAHGANVSAESRSGLKPIHNASLADRQNNAMALFDAGASPEATPKFPHIGARSYRFAAQWAQSRNQIPVTADDYRTAAQEFDKQIVICRDLVKKYEKAGSDAFWGGLGEDILMGTLAGLGHTTIVYQRPNPSYWWALKDKTNQQADACQKLCSFARHFGILALRESR